MIKGLLFSIIPVIHTRKYVNITIHFMYLPVKDVFFLFMFNINVFSICLCFGFILIGI